MTLKDLRVKLKSLVTDLVDERLLRQIGNEVAETVKTRTRKGFGVPQDRGPQKRLKSLKPSYKKQRRRLQNSGKLSPDTTPNKSNLTKTGSLLDNIVVQTSANTVEVMPQLTDRKKAKYQADAGRKAFNLSRSEYSKVLKLIESKIKTDINKKGL